MGKKGAFDIGISLTKKTADHSDRNNFDFSFYCDRCGKGWRSGKMPFTDEENMRIDNGEVRNIIWGRDHRFAFERANLEAQFHFNHCSDCGRWVCDDCFFASGSDERDLCRDCEKKAH